MIHEIDIKLGTVHRVDDSEKCFLSDQQHGIKKNEHDSEKSSAHKNTYFSSANGARGGGLNEHITHVEKCALLRIIN